MRTQRLVDISVRHSLYIERIKEHFYADSRVMLARLSVSVNEILNNVEAENVGELTKTKLRQLQVVLNDTYFGTLDKYAKALVERINAFLLADLSLMREVYAEEIREELGIQETDADTLLSLWLVDAHTAPTYGLGALLAKPDRAKAGEMLWSRVRNDPMAANGLRMVDLIDAFPKSAASRVVAILNAAWADNLAVRDLKAALVGKTQAPVAGQQQGSSSQIARTANQVVAVLDTSLQHVAQVVGVALGSLISDKYAWNAILDRGTCMTCRGRDGRVYEWGKGPVPPAHTRCRCHTAPVGEERGDQEPETLQAWFARQPAPVREEFGASFARGSYDKMAPNRLIEAKPVILAI